MVVGLIAAGGYILATPVGPDWRMWLIAGATMAGVLATRVNPRWFLAAGGAIGGFLLS